jgi:hypothetical protein
VQVGQVGKNERFAHGTNLRIVARTFPEIRSDRRPGVRSPTSGAIEDARV